MAVQNVQCQLAEMQIGRYVSGDSLSDEALAQLHRHIARCPACADVLADRRRALRSMLSHGFAAVTTDIPSSKEHLLINALRAKANAAGDDTPAAAPSEIAPANPKFDLLSKLRLNGKGYKPIIFAAALAAVLVGMGYFSRGQNSLLGANADAAFPTDTSQTHPAPAPAKATADESASKASTATDSPKGKAARALADIPAAEQAVDGKAKTSTEHLKQTPDTSSNASPNGENANVAEVATADLSSNDSQNAGNAAEENGPAVENHVPQSVIDAARARIRNADESLHSEPAAASTKRTRKHGSKPKHHHHYHHHAAKSGGPAIKIYDVSGKPLGSNR